jgi:hypothetical protein
MEAVMNYLPDSIRQQVDKAQILSWAYLIYRTYQLPIAEALHIATIPVTNHKVRLPDNVLRIIDVRHTSPGVDVPKAITRDYGDYRLIIAQEVYFSSPFYQQAKPLKYLGQNRHVLVEETLYCNKCETGFSIDHTMTCLTIDYPDGEVSVIYKTLVEEDGELMIPDDPDLMMGLSYFVQSRYWEDKIYAHEQNAFQIADSMHVKSRAHLESFKGRYLLSAINVGKHNAFVMRRNKFMNWKRN